MRRMVLNEVELTLRVLSYLKVNLMRSQVSLVVSFMKTKVSSNDKSI